MQPAIRLDLSDPQTQCLCLSCGGRYTSHVTPCLTCGSENLSSPTELVDLLEAAVPEHGRDKLANMVLAPIAGFSNAEQLRKVQSGLSNEGFPYLLVREEGGVVSSSSGGDATTVLAPEESLEDIHARIPDWLGAGPDGALDRLVCIWKGTEQDASHIKARLEEADIPLMLRSAPPQFGLAVANFGESSIHVESWDASRAREVLESLTVDPVPMDDLAGSRLRRRYRIARFCLAPPALTNIILAVFFSGTTIWPVALGQGILGIVLLALLFWSLREPEKAFALSLVLLLASALLGFLIDLPMVVGAGALGLIAVFYAFVGSVEASRQDPP